MVVLIKVPVDVPSDIPAGSIARHTFLHYEINKVELVPARQALSHLSGQFRELREGGEEPWQVHVLHKDLAVVGDAGCFFSNLHIIQTVPGMIF